jgi:NADPH-dependent glutamate synthase beta subunit-like oxidoreductase
MHHVQEENLVEAWRTICEENPMPRITGRVCPHPCEEECLRHILDERIAIRQVERYVGDWAFQQALSHFDTPPPPNGRKVAVIGSGPAGIGCAYHLLKQGYPVALFEAMPELGGLLRYGIPSYRLSKRVLSEELEMILENRVSLHPGVIVGRDISWEEIRSDFQGIFLGPGAQKSIRLGLEGEDRGGIVDGIQFLAAAEEDPTVSPGQKVLILGGGNTAFDVARTVLRLGGLPLILYRRSKEEMPAFEDEIIEAEEEGIEILTLVSPKEIVRDEDGVKGLICLRNRITDIGPDGRRGFVPVEGSENLVEGDLIITAIGNVADVNALPNDIKIVDGAVVITEYGSCKPDGLFAGGDVTQEARSIIHALASGKRAALGLDAYFKNQKNVDTNDTESQVMLDSDQINLHYFIEAPRKEAVRRPSQGRSSDFEEIEATFASDTAAQEAARCFRCGLCNACGNCNFFCPDMAVHFDFQTDRVIIDKNYCKGCCICIEECPRGVMSMENIE